MTNKRLQHELEHGKKISANAEDVWNWASPAGVVRANRRASLFLKEGRITTKDKVLEIGCGTGLFTEKIYKATGANITATDLSADLLNQARVRIPEVNFIIDDAMNMKLEDNTFDVVFGSSVIHHLEMKKALLEIYRVLKPHGRMVFAEPNMVNPQILIQKNIPYIKEKLGDSPDETAIIRWNFKKLMKKTGFRNIKIYPYDFLHPVTPVSLINIVNSIGKVIEKIPLIREIAGSVIIYGEK
jgi:ubiquinone/menaquinone biosynthesis C-methylase UbiE